MPDIDLTLALPDLMSDLDTKPAAEATGVTVLGREPDGTIVMVPPVPGPKGDKGYPGPAGPAGADGSGGTPAPHGHDFFIAKAEDVRAADGSELADFDGLEGKLLGINGSGQIVPVDAPAGGAGDGASTAIGPTLGGVTGTDQVVSGTGWADVTGTDLLLETDKAYRVEITYRVAGDAADKCKLRLYDPASTTEIAITTDVDNEQKFPGGGTGDVQLNGVYAWRMGHAIGVVITGANPSTARLQIQNRVGTADLIVGVGTHVRAQEIA